MKEKNYNRVEVVSFKGKELFLCKAVTLRHNKNSRRGIVVMDFNCYTGDCDSIPTHSNSLGK